MRLWHKDLIPILPRQQLLSQWRECCCIAKNIAEKGTPNHLLVNKVLDYSYLHFLKYGYKVINEMTRRGYAVSSSSLQNFESNVLQSTSKFKEPNDFVDMNTLYKEWHNFRYLAQCYYNLQEKFDNEGISQKEWKPIEKYFRNSVKKFSRKLFTFRTKVI